MKVKICRATIQRNPHAGNTVTYEFWPGPITFECEGPLPDFMRDNKAIYISEEGFEDARGTLSRQYYRGMIDDPDFVKDHMDEFMKLKVGGATHITIQQQNNRQPMHHAPEPEFTYEHEDPTVICSDCGQQVKGSLIDIHYDDDNGTSWTVCPCCKRCETFEDLEYEELSEIPKNELPL